MKSALESKLKDIRNIDDIPNNLFVPALIVVNLYSMRISNKNNKHNLESGFKDIIIKSIIGESMMISRSELINNFTFTNGSRIKLRNINSNSVYKISRIENIKVYVTKIPKIMSNMKNTGQYIISLSDNEEGVANSKKFAISTQLFKKLIVITRSDKLNSIKNKGKISKSKGRIDNNKNKISNINLNKDTDKKVYEKGLHDVTKNETVVNKNVIESSKQSVKSFSAVARVVNSDNEAIGYVLRDTTNNTLVTLSVLKVKNLARNKAIDNLMVSNSEQGTEYLRGNGIKIEMLRTIYK